MKDDFDLDDESTWPTDCKVRGESVVPLIKLSGAETEMIASVVVAVLPLRPGCKEHQRIVLPRGTILQSSRYESAIEKLKKSKLKEKK